MILRPNKAFGGKVTPIEKDTNLVPLDQVAKDLFDEARRMVAGDKTRGTSVETLIATAQKFTRGTSSEDRGSVGGPQQYSKTLAPGETQTIHLTFVAGLPATVAMTSTGPAKIQFDLSHVGGNSLASLKGHTANYSWTPVRDKKDGARKFKVTMTNTGNRPTTYTLTTN